MRLTERAAKALVHQAEAGRLPDLLIRAGMRHVITTRLRNELAVHPSRREAFWREAWAGPIALSPERANEQHYEIPPEFFDLVLGPRRKYSSAWWPEGIETLTEAENAMLDLYEDRAQLADGQTVLDLGCGWGSFCLRAAEKYPESLIVAVSNSHRQTAYIERRADAFGLENVATVTSDINTFRPRRRFDRIVSIEMLEHVRNHRTLFDRMHRWVESDGALFTHVFAHQTLAYTFDVGGPGSWMAQTFFTDGAMPSRSLLPKAAGPSFDKTSEWWIDGTHYARTLETWLDRLDANLETVHELLRPAYGCDTAVWVQRWRMFFMACSEMFAFRDGSEWGVVHQLFRPKPL